jgi:hypothetical protein
MDKRGKRVSKCAKNEKMSNLYPNLKQPYNQQLGEGNIAKRPLEEPQIKSPSGERELELSISL